MENSFDVPARALASAVKYTARWLAARPTEPAHGCLLFEVADGTLTISGFGENVTARATVDVAGSASGSFLVAGRLIDQLAGTIPDKPIRFEQGGSIVAMSSGRFSATLPALHEHDYPSLPGEAPAAGLVDGDELAAAVARVGGAAARPGKVSDARPAFGGIYIAFEDDALTLSATDTYRAARQSVAWRRDGGNGTTSALVPASSLTDADDAFVGLDSVMIGVETGKLSLTTPTRSMVTRTLGVQYPIRDLDPILNVPTTARVTFKVKDLAQPLKRMALLGGRESDVVRLTFGPGSITLSVSDTDIGKGGTDEIDAVYDGPDDVAVSLFSGLLHAVLTSAPGDEVELSLIPDAPKKPVLITSAADPTWRNILVPLRKIGA